MIRSLLLLVFVACFASCVDIKKEEAAIKELLEKEAATWRSGDHVAHASCWSVKPYSFCWVSTLEGKMIDVPKTDIVSTSGDAPGGSAVLSNFKIQIDGDHAWVSHDELSTDTVGKKTASKEIRLLEKEQGQWKLVGQSIHEKRL